MAKATTGQEVQLFSISELSPTEIESRDKYFGEKIVNLLRAMTPTAMISSRVGRGGSEFPYVHTYYVIERLDVVFGSLWDFEVLSANIEEYEPGAWVHAHVQGKLTVKIPVVKERITEPDGTVKESFEFIEITRSNFGGSDVKYFTAKEKEGTPMDLGDDLKAAAADALKKCASMFGICSDVYNDKDILNNAGPDEQQKRVYFKRCADELNWGEEKATAFINNEFNEAPKEGDITIDDLNKGEYNELMAKVRKRAAILKTSKEQSLTK